MHDLHDLAVAKTTGGGQTAAANARMKVRTGSRSDRPMSVPPAVAGGLVRPGSSSDRPVLSEPGAIATGFLNGEPEISDLRFEI